MIWSSFQTALRSQCGQWICHSLSAMGCVGFGVVAGGRLGCGRAGNKPKLPSDSLPGVPDFADDEHLHLTSLGMLSGLEYAGDGHAGTFPDASQHLFWQEDFDFLLALAAQHPAGSFATDGDPAFEHARECDVPRDRNSLWWWR